MMFIQNKLCKPITIEISKLHPFENHPYKVLDNEEMETLAESIRTEGILSPLIVRPLENTGEYEVISGHRRLCAAQKAGLKTVPALVCEISREEAAILLVDSNLHREHILPSEKAFAYKLKMEALSHQGSSGQLGQKRPGVKAPPFLACMQTPFHWAKYAPGADYCPPAKLPPPPG